MTGSLVLQKTKSSSAPVAGLDPATHVFMTQGVDGRVEPGHGGVRGYIVGSM
jgi:hypothetical protein